MKLKLKIGAVLMVLIAFSSPIAAQDTIRPGFKFTPVGRILVDGAVFAPQHKAGFSDGVSLTDVRLGGKAEFGNWLAKIDVSYSDGAFNLKDVYIQYKFNRSNLLRGGYFIPQFGMQSSVSSAEKETFIAPGSDTYMRVSKRNIGLMYLHYGDKFLGSGALFAGTKLTEKANNNGKISMGVVSRLLLRPLTEDGKVAQAGVSGWYQSAYHTCIDEDGEEKISEGYFDFSADYPTKVNDVPLLSTYISDSKSVLKFSPEFQLAFDRFALGGQYYYMNVNRKNGLRSFTAQGVYGVFRALVLGDRSYGYSYVDGTLTRPNPKTLECVLSYNYTNANDSRAAIHGGIANGCAITLNYYINKYMLARVQWSYTRQSGIPDVKSNHVNIIQARVQFKF